VLEVVFLLSMHVLGIIGCKYLLDMVGSGTKQKKRNTVQIYVLKFEIAKEGKKEEP